jgi:NADH dehydrogenase
VPAFPVLEKLKGDHAWLKLPGQKFQLMILITGGTGFIGRVLIQQLAEAGQDVRVLVRPSPRNPKLPRGIPVEVTLTSLNDKRGLQAAMTGVDTVYHLIGGEWQGVAANLLETDIQATQAVVEAAVEAGVDRLFYLSHLGADRASAYPVMKSKAIAEEYIRRSGMDYTILRTALVFGPDDGFTTGLARLLYGLPFFFLIPGEGDSVIQPLWVEDLVTCLTWALGDDLTRNQTFEVGGPEYLTFFEILQTVIQTVGVQRTILPIRPPYLRALTVFLESLLPGLPVSVYWLDYLASNRSCSLDTIPRVFGLMPSRFSHRLDYLVTGDWRRAFWRSLFRRR